MFNEKLIPLTIARKNEVDEINNKFVYSTGGTIIGKWIDGKPIYRQVISNLNVNVPSGNWTQIATVNDLDTLISVIIKSANQQINACNNISVDDNSKIMCYQTLASTLPIKYIIIEYTKTID